MDTDDLSRETYDGIIVESERFNHNLTLFFGLLADDCADETEFVVKSIKLINRIKKAKLSYLPEIFFDDVPNLAELNKLLDKIIENIKNIRQIPIEKRHFDF